MIAMFIIESKFRKMMSNIPGLKHEYGWGNGYVLLPPSHPYYGVEYDDLHGKIDVHGGLTLSHKFRSDTFLEWISGVDIFGDVNNKNYQDFDGYWILGFDTAHYSDNMITCSKEYVLEETKSLLDQCNKEFRRLRKKKLNKLNEVKGLNDG